MQYEIWDAFNQVALPRTYTRHASAVSVAFIELANTMADHIDDELDDGETDSIVFNTKRDGDEFHIWIDGSCEHLMIVRPKMERTVAELY